MIVTHYKDLWSLSVVVDTVVCHWLFMSPVFLSSLMLNFSCPSIPQMTFWLSSCVCQIFHSLASIFLQKIFWRVQMLEWENNLYFYFSKNTFTAFSFALWLAMPRGRWWARQLAANSSNNGGFIFFYGLFVTLRVGFFAWRISFSKSCAISPVLCPILPMV